MQNSGLQLSPEEYHKFITDIKSALIPLVKSHVPETENLDSNDDLNLEKINQGLNNHVFTAQLKNANNEVLQLIVKKITKKDESEQDPATVYYPHVREHIKKKDYGPKVYYEDADWVIEAKALGKTLGVDDMMDEEVCKTIVRKAADYTNCLNDIDFALLNKQNIYVDLLVRGILNKIDDEIKLISEEKSPELAQLVNTMVDFLRNDEIHEIINSINDVNYMFVLGHGDLNAFNILIDDESGDMTLLDFENSCYLPIGYDIAYLLMSRVHTFKGKEVIFDLEKWHSEEFLRGLVKEYLAYLECCQDVLGNEAFFEKVVECVKKCCLKVNLFWICWCVFKIRGKKAKFDWESYIQSRINLTNHIMKVYFE